MLELGKKLSGRLLEMPKQFLVESAPEKIYQLRIETEGVMNEEEVTRLLVEKLYSKFRAKITWIRIDGNTIDLQLVGSPFAWGLLLLFIPSILAIAGIGVVLVAVFSVVSAVPGWAWAVLAVGVGLILVGPVVGKAITAPAAPFLSLRNRLGKR